MKGFTIKKLKKELEITKFEYNKEGFNYKFPNKKYFLNDFVMFKPELIEILIINSFNKKYRKILEFYLKTISEDDETTSGNLVIALDELSRLRTILLKKYNPMHNFLELGSKLVDIITSLIDGDLIITDREKIVCSSNKYQDLNNLKINQKLINLIDEREAYQSEIGEKIEYEKIDFIGKWHLGKDINMNFYNQN